MFYCNVSSNRDRSRRGGDCNERDRSGTAASARARDMDSMDDECDEGVA